MKAFAIVCFIIKKGDIMEFEITKENFDSEVLNEKGTVLIDFWAEWCGPCMMMAPVVAEIAEQRDDVKVCKVNSDEQPELCEMFSVNSIPAFFVLKNGEVVNNAVGYMKKEKLESML